MQIKMPLKINYQNWIHETFKSSKHMAWAKTASALAPIIGSQLTERRDRLSPSYIDNLRKSCRWLFSWLYSKCPQRKVFPFKNHLNCTVRDMLLSEMLLRKKKKKNNKQLFRDCKFPAAWAGNTYSAVTVDRRILDLNGCLDSNRALSDESRSYVPKHQFQPLQSHHWAPCLPLWYVLPLKHCICKQFIFSSAVISFWILLCFIFFFIQVWFSWCSKWH